MARYKYYGEQYLRETENRDLYFEEIERIEEIISQYEDDPTVKLVHFDLPTIPRRITKRDIEELSTIDEDYIEQFIEYEDDFDELPTLDEAEYIVDEFKSIYKSAGNKHFSDFMDKWLEHVENNPDVGKRRTAGMLQGMLDDGFSIERRVRYNLNDTLSFLSEILDQMPGISVVEKLHIMESFEAEEIWNESS